MFTEIKETIARVREKKWAEPVGKALGITATVVDCVGDFIPGVGFLGGALKLGAELLNPETSIDDLKSELKDIQLDLNNDRELSSRARKALEKEKAELEESIANIDKNQTELRSNILEVKKDVKTGFRKIAEDLKTLEKDVSTIKDKISATYDIVCDIQYKNGIDRIEATYEAFTAGSSDIGKMIGRFHQFALEFQTEYYQHMKTEKISKFLKLVMEKDGAEACQAMYQYILVVKSKYLQMMTMYFIYNNEADLVAKEFEKFNKDFYELKTHFEKIIKQGGPLKFFEQKKQTEMKNEDSVDFRPLPKPPQMEQSFNTVALYDFDGQSPSELSFKKGDNVIILKTNTSGWWSGRIGGKTGLCPSNFLQKQKEQKMNSKPRLSVDHEHPLRNTPEPEKKGRIKRCHNGHPLKKVSRNTQWRCNSRRDGGCWSFPEFDFYTGVERYRCNTCDFDYCEDCYNWDENDDKYLKKCPSGHPLRSIPDYEKERKSIQNSWRCNSKLRGCKYHPAYFSYLESVQIYRCISCDYDNCEDCVKR